eukprot:9175846-Alexandrium_andersonii.AAC.1
MRLPFPERTRSPVRWSYTGLPTALAPPARRTSCRSAWHACRAPTPPAATPRSHRPLHRRA